MKRAITISMMAGLVLMTGCASTTPTQQSTLIGTGVGVALGSILGHNLGGTQDDRLLGMAAGGAIGGVLGNQVGRNNQTQQQLNALQQQQFITTVWIENSNGSKTPVVLRQTDGGQYIGPRGEYYSTMPSQDQLKQVYGM